MGAPILFITKNYQLNSKIFSERDENPKKNAAFTLTKKFFIRISSRKDKYLVWNGRCKFGKELQHISDIDQPFRFF